MSFLCLLARKHQSHIEALIATHELSPPNDSTNGQYIPDGEKFNFRFVSSHEIRRAVMSEKEMT